MYVGAFSGALKLIPNVKLDSTKTQTVYISIEQSAQLLASTVIAEVSEIESEFDLEFVYANVNEPCSLIFELRGDDRYNQDFPIEVTKLEVDDLYTSPLLPHVGRVMLNDYIISSDSNALWCTGKLVYTFRLPMVANRDYRMVTLIVTDI